MHLDVSAKQVLICIWMYLENRSLCWSTPCRHELHLDMSTLQRPLLHLDVSIKQVPELPMDVSGQPELVLIWSTP
jgi:hypothetical protein